MVPRSRPCTQVLGALHACHLLAVGVGALAPGAHSGPAGRKEALSVILLNSISLSVACRRAATPLLAAWNPRV